MRRFCRRTSWSTRGNRLPGSPSATLPVRFCLLFSVVPFLWCLGGPLLVGAAFIGARLCLLCRAGLVVWFCVSREDDPISFVTTSDLRLKYRRSMTQSIPRSERNSQTPTHPKNTQPHRTIPSHRQVKTQYAPGADQIVLPCCVRCDDDTRGRTVQASSRDRPPAEGGRTRLRGVPGWTRAAS